MTAGLYEGATFYFILTIPPSYPFHGEVNSNLRIPFLVPHGIYFCGCVYQYCTGYHRPHVYPGIILQRDARCVRRVCCCFFCKNLKALDCVKINAYLHCCSCCRILHFSKFAGGGPWCAILTADRCRLQTATDCCCCRLLLTTDCC